MWVIHDTGTTKNVVLFSFFQLCISKGGAKAAKQSQILTFSRSPILPKVRKLQFRSFA
jgi:hypothetical protein